MMPPNADRLWIQKEIQVLRDLDAAQRKVEQVERERDSLFAEKFAAEQESATLREKLALLKSGKCSGGGGFGSCRDQRDPELCANCERDALQRQCADLTAQLQAAMGAGGETLRAFDRCNIDLREHNQRLYVEITTLRNMLVDETELLDWASANWNRFAVPDTCQNLRQAFIDARAILGT